MREHSFCSECIEVALKVCNKCPVCQQPQGTIQGNQPRGQMTFRVDRYSVPGYEGRIPNREKPTLRTSIRYYYISVWRVLKKKTHRQQEDRI